LARPAFLGRTAVAGRLGRYNFTASTSRLCTHGGFAGLEKNMSCTLSFGGAYLEFVREELTRPRGGRRHNSILDSHWSGRFDSVAFDGAMRKFCPKPEPTPVFVAGKAGSPDKDAQWLALRVLSAPSAALSALLDQISFGPDEWMLCSIWFPYQTYLPCWFANFQTEYDGQLEFGFRARDGQKDCTVVEANHKFMDTSNAAGYCQDSFTSIPSVVWWVIDEMVRYQISSETFKGILGRIGIPCLRSDWNGVALQSENSKPRPCWMTRC
jgi:hypothetical protein